jgi:hypothetical protein
MDYKKIFWSIQFMPKIENEVPASTPTATAAAIKVARKATTITSEGQQGAANSEISGLMTGAAYPSSVWVTNNTIAPLISPELNIIVPAHSTREATARSHDQLQRAISDFEQLCVINRWHDGIIVSNQPPDSP